MSQMFMDYLLNTASLAVLCAKLGPPRPIDCETR
jgi:hypothetical protein